MANRSTPGRRRPKVGGLGRLVKPILEPRDESIRERRKIETTRLFGAWAAVRFVSSSDGSSRVAHSTAGPRGAPGVRGHERHPAQRFAEGHGRAKNASVRLPTRRPQPSHGRGPSQQGIPASPVQSLTFAARPSVTARAQSQQ